MQFSLSHPAYILPGIVTAIGCELIIDCVNRVEQTAFVVPANTYETWEESYFTEEKAERMGVRSHRFHSFSPGCLGTSVILFVLCVLGCFCVGVVFVSCFRTWLPDVLQVWQSENATSDKHEVQPNAS